MNAQGLNEIPGDAGNVDSDCARHSRPYADENPLGVTKYRGSDSVPSTARYGEPAIESEQA